MNKKLDLLWKSKTGLIFLICLFLISSYALAENGGAGSPEDVFKNDPSPENFDKLPSPTAEDLLKITNPTQDNFERLLSYSPDEAVKYLQRKYNNGFALEFYKNPENVGKNPEVDKKFFSGDYSVAPATASRDNIRKSIGAAEKYFLLEHKATYVFEKIEDDFEYVYDKEKKEWILSNGGKRINLGPYKERSVEIKTVAKGIIIIEEKQKTEFIGEGEGSVEWNGDKDEFSFIDKEGVKQKFLRSKVGDVIFEVNGDVIKVTGAADLYLMVKGNKVTLNNYGGTAVINPKTGEIKADNALYDESLGRLHVDGRFHITKDERTAENPFGKVDVETYSFGGKTKIHTVLIDKVTTWGVSSAGRSKDRGESVLIHLEPLDPKKVEDVPIPTAGELKGRVEEIKARSRTDLKENSEVWIKASRDGSRVVVEARGKVDVGHYDVDVMSGYTGELDETKPRFRSKDGRADFHYEKDSGIEHFEMRGLAEYSDSQLSKAKNFYDGSIFRKIPSGFDNIDIFETECAECSVGDKITKVSKRISIARGISDEYGGLVEEILTGDIVLTFRKIAEGTKVEEDKSGLGDLAKVGVDDFAAIGRNLLFKDAEGNNLFEISQNGVGRYERREEGFEFKPTFKDLKVRSKIGDKLIIVPEEERANLDVLLEFLEEKRIKELPGQNLVFENEELRRYVASETGLDIFHLDDETYINRVAEAGELLEKLKIEGITFDLDGNCRSGCERLEASRGEGGQLGWIYTALMTQRLNGKIMLIDADAAIAREEGRSILELEDKKRKIQALIDGYNTEREGYAEIYRFKEGIVVDLNSPEFKEDKDEVLRIKREQKATSEKIRQNKGEIEYLEKRRKAFLKERELTAGLVIELNELRTEIRNLEKENNALRQEDYRREGEIGNVALKHAKVRPDVAAELCFLGGYAGCVEANAQKLAPLAPELSNFYSARASLMEDDTVGAGVYLAGIEDPDKKQEIKRGLGKIALKQAAEFRQEAKDTFRSVLETNAQFEEGRDHWLNYIPNLGWFFSSPDRMNEERVIQQAKHTELNSRILVSLMNSGVTPDKIPQLKPEEIKKITGMSGLSEFDLQGFSNYQLNPEFEMVSATYEGKPIDRNVIADYYWNKAQLAVKAAHLEESAGYGTYKFLAKNFPDTSKGKWAAEKAKLIEGGKAYTTSGGRLSAAFLDVTWLAGGVFAGARILSTGTRATLATSRFATYGVKAGRFLAKTGKIVTTPVKFVGKTAARVPGAKKAGTLIRRTAAKVPTEKIKTVLRKEVFTSSNTKLLRAEREIAEDALKTSKSALQRAQATGKSSSVIKGLEQVVAKEAKGLTDVKLIQQASKIVDKTKGGVGGTYRKAVYAVEEKGLGKIPLVRRLTKTKEINAYKELRSATTKFDEAFKTGDKIKGLEKLADDVFKAEKGWKTIRHSTFTTKYVKQLEEETKAKQALAEQKITEAIKTLPEGHVMEARCIPKCEVAVVAKTGEEAKDLTQGIRKTLRNNGVVEEDFARQLKNFEEPLVPEGHAILADGERTMTSLREQVLGRTPAEGVEVSPALQNKKTDLLVKRDLEEIIEIEGKVIAKTPTQHEEFSQFVMKSSLTGIDDWAKGSDDLISALRKGDEVQVATIDIHKFKDINTRYGHEGGNVLLRSTAQEIENVLKSRGIDVSVSHKGGKTFKVVARNVDEDLAKILQEDIDLIRWNVHESSKLISPFKGKKPITLDEFNFYVGVSEKTKLAPGLSLGEVEVISRDLNFQSLKAGKYGQVRLDPKLKLRERTQIVKHGEVTPEMRRLGIQSVPLDLEQRIAKSSIEIQNEYKFFGEDIKFDDLEGLLESRSKIRGLDDIKKIDYVILDKKLKYTEVENIYLGNEQFKAYSNFLLEKGGLEESRKAFIVGGDELAYVVSRPTEEAVSISRIDINFFGKTNLKYGIEKGDELRDEALKIINGVLEDAKLGKINDVNDIIGKEIIKRFDDLVKREKIFIEAEIEGQFIKARPSLTIGSVESDKNIIALTRTGEKNGASILNKVADEQQELQKILGKQKLLDRAEEIKEINIDDFYTTAKITQKDIDEISLLIKTETDDLVIEFIHNAGKKPIFKEGAKPSLEGVIDEASSGIASREAVTTELVVVREDELSVTLGTLAESSVKPSFSKLELAAKNDNFIKAVEKTPGFTDEGIARLSRDYYDELITKGVQENPIGASGLKRMLNEQLGIIREDLTRERGYLDFLATIDVRFPQKVVKVHLGTDGVEYTNYAYRLMTNNPSSNSVAHYISRMSLATDEELSWMLKQVETGKVQGGIEALLRIGSENVRLYEDMTDVIISARNLHVEGKMNYFNALESNFNDVMSISKNKQKVIELVSHLQNDVDLSKPIVLIDFAGTNHVQPQTLKEGIKWLGKEENWNLLSNVQKNMLGDNRKLFANAKIDIHVGVTSNPGKIEGFYEFKGMDAVSGIIEGNRGVKIDEASLLTGTPSFKPTDAPDQTKAFVMKLIIADEIQARKAAVAAVAAR